MRPEEDITLAVAPGRSAGRCTGWSGAEPPGLSGKGRHPCAERLSDLCGQAEGEIYQEAQAEYIKRLSPYCRLTLVELPEEKLPQDPSQAQIDAALEKESQAICQAAPQHQPGVPVRGGQAALQRGAVRFGGDLGAQPAKHLAFVIGGSYGLAERLKGESWVKLSMSPMTFPHHLARVMLLEQLYRAFKIREGPATTNDRVPGLKTCSPWICQKIRWKFMPACGTMSTTACPSGFY